MRQNDHDALASDLVTVFEAANDTTKELYVGVTSLFIDAVIRSHYRRPPREIAHWAREHQISYRCVEYAMPRDAASEFVKNYTQSTAVKGWKTVGAHA
jgi:hypothetical protein